MMLTSMKAETAQRQARRMQNVTAVAPNMIGVPTVEDTHGSTWAETMRLRTLWTEHTQQLMIQMEEQEAAAPSPWISDTDAEEEMQIDEKQITLRACVNWAMVAKGILIAWDLDVQRQLLSTMGFEDIYKKLPRMREGQLLCNHVQLQMCGGTNQWYTGHQCVDCGLQMNYQPSVMGFNAAKKRLAAWKEQAKDEIEALKRAGFRFPKGKGKVNPTSSQQPSTESVKMQARQEATEQVLGRLEAEQGISLATMTGAVQQMTEAMGHLARQQSTTQATMEQLLQVSAGLVEQMGRLAAQNSMPNVNASAPSYGAIIMQPEDPWGAPPTASSVVQYAVPLSTSITGTSNMTIPLQALGGNAAAGPPSHRPAWLPPFPGHVEESGASTQMKASKRSHIVSRVAAGDGSATDDQANMAPWTKVKPVGQSEDSE